MRLDLRAKANLKKKTVPAFAARFVFLTKITVLTLKNLSETMVKVRLPGRSRPAAMVDRDQKSTGPVLTFLRGLGERRLPCVRSRNATTSYQPLQQLPRQTGTMHRHFHVSARIPLQTLFARCSFMGLQDSARPCTPGQLRRFGTAPKILPFGPAVP